MPVSTLKAASNAAVPLRTYSNSRRAGRPGATGWLGAAGSRMPMPVFSSMQNVGPSVGGSSSNSMISTALARKLGSRSCIQESKTVQADVVRLEDRGPPEADRLAGGAQAKLGVFADVDGQVLDRPVALAFPTKRLGRLTGQHDDLGLDLWAIEPRRRTVGTVEQACQSGLGEVRLRRTGWTSWRGLAAQARLSHLHSAQSTLHDGSRGWLLQTRPAIYLPVWSLSHLPLRSSINRDHY